MTVAQRERPQEAQSGVTAGATARRSWTTEGGAYGRHRPSSRTFGGLPQREAHLLVPT